MDKIIQIIESQIYLISKTTGLYDPQYCPKDNEDFSLKSSHIIRKFVQMKKLFEFAYGFKSHCTSITEHFSKLEGCLHSIPKNNNKIFPPFGNEFLPPSKNISLTNCVIMYQLKQKDICDYDPRCIVSSGLIFYDIIINIISNKRLAHHNEENDCLIKKIENNIILYVQGVTSRLLLEKRNLRVSRSSMCTFIFKKNSYEKIFNPHIKKQHLKWR